MDNNRLAGLIEQSKQAVNTGIHIQGVSYMATTGKPEDKQAIAQLLRRLAREHEHLFKELEKLAGSMTLPI